MANTILLKGRGIRREAIAGGTITPGHLVVMNSSGALVVAPTADVAYIPMFAVEDDLNGKEITDNYVANDFVQAEILGPGCEVYALVAAAATAITKGAYLEAGADGTLALLTTGVHLAQALEAVDNSAGGTPARIRVALL